MDKHWYKTKAATTVVEHKEMHTCILYNTPIVQWNDLDGTIRLDSGGHRTKVTKTRMNEVADHYDLDFHVYQKLGEWFVVVDEEDVPFEDHMVIKPRTKRNVYEYL